MHLVLLIVIGIILARVILAFAGTALLYPKTFGWNVASLILRPLGNLCQWIVDSENKVEKNLGLNGKKSSYRTRILLVSSMIALFYLVILVMK